MMSNVQTTLRDPLEQQPQQQQSLFRFNRLPTMPSATPPTTLHSRSQSFALESSPFLRLPTEIRLQIYSLLVLPRRPSDLNPCRKKIAASAQDSFDYDKRQRGTDREVPEEDGPMPRNPVLCIRTLDPSLQSQQATSRPPYSRTSYSVQSDRLRGRCMTTTYHCVNNPSHMNDHLAIMRANKQIHAEAAGLLYGTYTFDFDSHVEAIVPFLSDLTPFARGCIKRIRVVKRALAYEKEFDRAEWSAAWRYLTAPDSNISLTSLSLGVVAGRPGPHGWDQIPQYSAADYNLLKHMDGMEWMHPVLALGGLEELDVHAITEHCPPANNSNAMASYIRFSASVEGGFRTFLKGELLASNQARQRRPSTVAAAA